jgi:protein gp37
LIDRANTKRARMGENTKIEWATHTFNPWVGCQKVSPGCDHCYAEAMMDTRWGRVKWGPHGERKRTSEANWRKPLQWARAAKRTGERPRVFCASLADWLDNQVPTTWRADLLELIDETQELDWLLLTKRPENYQRLVAHQWPSGSPANVWLGFTAEDHENFVRRYKAWIDLKPTVMFVSYEPAIGPIHPPIPPIDWIICGGESGNVSREMNPQWARDVRDYCAEWSIPFFMKQMSGKAPIPDDLMIRQFPK